MRMFKNYKTSFLKVSNVKIQPVEILAGFLIYLATERKKYLY